MEALYRRQTDTCLPILDCLQAKRATRQRRLLLQYVTRQLMLLARPPEAIIATLLPADGTAKKSIFPTAIKLLIAVGSFIACTDGGRATPPSCASIGTYKRVVVSAHLSLQACVAFPNHGNTHLPRRATGPLWRPPSGHFFPPLRYIYPSRSGYIRVDAPFWIPSQIRPFPPALLAGRALRRACPP